jgi:ABC-type glycerol-3-phosphate transport system substrate-binding protein
VYERPDQPEWGFGGEVTDSDNAGYLFNTPESRQALTNLKELQESGCAWLDSEADPKMEFASRGALFTVGSLFDIPEQREAFARAGNADEWVVIPFLSRRQPAMDAYGPSLIVTRSTPPGQLAGWLVINWLLYPPNQAQWVGELQTYPTRMSSLTYLPDAGLTSPQWAQALALLPVAHSEPSLASWSVMRWAVQDAMTQLFDPQFKADQIPALLENLDSVGAEIVEQVR